jgi:GTP-binding protein EngB required for normal cell division
VAGSEGSAMENFHCSCMMFIYLKGHHLLEYCFSLTDARVAANDVDQSALG